MTRRRDLRVGRVRWAVAAAVAVVGTGCSGEPGASSAPATPSSTTSELAPASPSVTPSAAAKSAAPTAEPRAVRPADLDVGVAVRTVQHLAGEIGPREATSPAYREAADWVAGRLERQGRDVRLRPVDAPAGFSWDGVPVRAGTSYNVVATPPGFRPGDPHLLVGAHLDTVPQSPGAEDNASGVGVLLAAGEAMRGRTTRLPVVLVAFGAEEPRGDPEDHHYGSRAYVASLSPRERRSVRGMISLDRVGVGAVVPVGSGLEGGGGRAAEEVLRAARRADVPVAPEANRSSDHWSFVRAGLPGVRLGSTSYGAYHSPDDVPGVVDPAQLRRTARILLAWLATR